MHTGGHLKNVCWRARGIRAREDDGGGRGRSHHALAAAAGICASTASGHRPAQPPSLAASLLAEGQRRVTVIRAARPDEPPSRSARGSASDAALPTSASPARVRSGALLPLWAPCGLRARSAVCGSAGARASVQRCCRVPYTSVFGWATRATRGEKNLDVHCVRQTAFSWRKNMV